MAYFPTTIVSSGTIKSQIMAMDGVTPIESHGDIDGEKYLATAMIQAVHASSKNVTTSPLAAGAVWYGTLESTLGVAGIQTMLRADQNLTLYVDQSGDDINWDLDKDSYTYLASLGGNAWTTQALGSSYRVRLVNNSGTNCTYTRLSTALCPTVEAVPRTLSTNGNFRVDVQEMLDTFGVGAMTSPSGMLRTTSTIRLVGAALASVTGQLDTVFWGSTAVGSGTTSIDGQLVLGTRYTANSQVVVQSTRTARYIAGQNNYYRAQTRLPATNGACVRRFGAYTTTDGYFFELNGNARIIVTRRGGVDTKVVSGSFNGDGGNAYTLDENVHTYEIYWTAKSAWFCVDDVIIHKVEGNLAPLSNTQTLPVRQEVINSAGNTQPNTIEVRTATINRMGSMTSLPIHRNVAGATQALLKDGAGNLHRIMINTAGAAGATLRLYDGLQSAATWQTWGTFNTGVGSSTTISGQGNFTFDFAGAPFYTGLYVINTGAADLSIIYE